MGKSYVSNNSGVKNQRKMRCRDGSHSLIKKPSLLHRSLLLGENLQCLLSQLAPLLILSPPWKLHPPLETEPPIPPPTEDKGYKCDPSLTLPPLLVFPLQNTSGEVSLTLLQIGFGERIFASANSENPSHATEAAQHVEAADTHTSLYVTADESSLPSTMGDQNESLSPTTIPSCMAPVTADAFILRAVTLPPLDDDNHNFSETQEDKDQVSASSQRILRERPVKQSKKGQDMYDWSLVKSRGKRGRGRG
ncbi:hypothetical protein F2Q68_00030276 [Brassica cretica]|uniref:Uncharacterized protein n=1 Tax=Brassica cretica TaxID=69181 RepID=A0A8S9G948_BRACR|nr:hypothetical protein F2Q68_00030276 [Brassica cretica]